MRAVGFSTGAIALGRFDEALALLKATTADAVELSALRTEELDPLIERLDAIDLTQFRHVSVHAPSRYEAQVESHVVRQLGMACERGFYVVAHPDAMHDVRAWAVLGDRLCVENMDKRKPSGRTAEELEAFFSTLPAAGLCFDIAHARQVDGSMTEAYRILTAYADRVRQVHVSEVNTASRHVRISGIAAADYREVVELIPVDAAAIIEATVSHAEIARELDAVRRLLDATGALA